jgi:hypothetical protein
MVISAEPGAPDRALVQRRERPDWAGRFEHAIAEPPQTVQQNVRTTPVFDDEHDIATAVGRSAMRMHRRSIGIDGFAQHAVLPCRSSLDVFCVVANPNQRSSARATRPARTPVQGVRAKLGSVDCALANLSVTGAMLRSRLAVAVGREAQLLIVLPKAVTSKVRVVRCEPLDVALPGAAVWRKQEFALGVHFLDHHSDLTAALKGLARAGAPSHAQARVLVLGKDDEVSGLVDRPRRGGIQDAPAHASAPRGEHRETNGAKAVVINLESTAILRPAACRHCSRRFGNRVAADCSARDSLAAALAQNVYSDTRVRVLLVRLRPKSWWRRWTGPFRN